MSCMNEGQTPKNLEMSKLGFVAMKEVIRSRTEIGPSGGLVN